MKLLIKITAIMLAVLFVILYIVLNIWGGAIVSSIGSRVSGEELEVQKASFVPWNLSMRLKKVSLPERKICFSEGKINLLPLQMELRGLEIEGNTIATEERLILRVRKTKNWDIDLTGNNIDIGSVRRLHPDAKTIAPVNGNVDIKINGYYYSRKEECNLDFLVVLDNLILEGDIDEQNKITQFLQGMDQPIEVDFTYEGPVSEFDQFYRYRPGPKTLVIIARQFLSKKFFE